MKQKVVSGIVVLFMLLSGFPLVSFPTMEVAGEETPDATEIIVTGVVYDVDLNRVAEGASVTLMNLVTAGTEVALTEAEGSYYIQLDADFFTVGDYVRANCDNGINLGSIDFTLAVGVNMIDITLSPTLPSQRPEIIPVGIPGDIDAEPLLPPTPPEPDPPEEIDAPAPTVLTQTVLPAPPEMPEPYVSFDEQIKQREVIVKDLGLNHKMPKNDLYVGQKAHFIISLENTLDTLRKNGYGDENSFIVDVDIYVTGPGGSEEFVSHIEFGEIKAEMIKTKSFQFIPNAGGDHFFRAHLSYGDIEYDDYVGFYVLSGTIYWVGGKTIDTCPYIVENDEIQMREGDLIIQSGGCLILKNTVLRIDSLSHGELKIDIQPSGSLEVLEGSKVTASSSLQMYKIFNHGTTKIKSNSEVKWAWGDADPSLPGGIQNFGTLEMDNAIITEPATHGIYTENPITVTNSVFTRDLLSNSFNGHGIYAKDTDDITIENVFINNAQRDGIHIVNTMAQVRGVTVDNTERGIYIEGTIATITGNNFTNNYNGMVLSNAVGNIENNLIDGNTYHGIRMENAGSSVVRNNKVKNNFDGIVALGVSEPVIEDNILTGNLNNSIHVLHFGAPYIKNNQITDTRTGILVENITRRSSSSPYTLRQLADGVFEREFKFPDGGGQTVDYITVPPDADILSVSFNLEGLDPPVEPAESEDNWELPEPDEVIPTRMEDIDVLNAMLNSNPYDVEEGIATEYGPSYRLETYADGSKKHYTPYPTYHDGEAWVIGDLTILPVDVGIYSYEVTKNNFDSFFTTGDAPVKYHIRDADHGFTTTIMGLEDVNEHGIVSKYIHAQDATESTDGNRILYSDIFDNMDLRFDVRAGQIKDIYFIDENLGFDGDLRVDTEVKYDPALDVIADNSVQTGDFSTSGTVSFKDSDGKTVFRLPPAFAWDANGNVTDAEYVGEVKGGTLKLGIQLPGKWLNHDSRAYPVTLDPAQYISGEILTTTWISNTSYVITGNAQVPIGNTLTIEPGTSISFPQTLTDLTISGTLHAEGTEIDRIVFSGGGTHSYKLVLESDNNLLKYARLDNLHGTFIENGSWNRIENNIIACNLNGLVIEDGFENFIANNTVQYCYNPGILVSSSSNNTLHNNSVSDSGWRGDGIVISNSENNTLTGNALSANDAFNLRFEGEKKHHFSHFIDTTNTVNGEPVHYFFDRSGETIPDIHGGHITIAASFNVILRDSSSTNGDPISVYLSKAVRVNESTATSNHIGVYLYRNEWSTVNNSIISSNRHAGISAYEERLSVIKTNTLISNTYYGVHIESGYSNSVGSSGAATRNIITGSRTGVFLTSGSKNTIAANRIDSTSALGWKQGIRLYSETQNSIATNEVWGASVGILAQFSDTTIWGTNTIHDNTGYGIDIQNGVNCVVQGSVIHSNFGGGIHIQGDGHKVYQNEIYENSGSYGLYVHGPASGLNIYKNNIHDNPSAKAIYLSYVSGAHIWENDIANNSEGVSLRYSPDNHIYRNQISDNGKGVYIMDSGNTDGSENNAIYNNAFINNSQQVNLPGNNRWDNGYPYGGNYWDDYNGADDGSQTDYPYYIYDDAMGDTSGTVPFPGPGYDRHPMTFNYAWLYPGNVTIDIGADGVIDWTHAGRFFRLESMDDSNSNMSFEVTQAFKDVQMENFNEINVITPIVFSTETIGTLEISDIVIELNMTDSMIYENTIDTGTYGIQAFSSQSFITDNTITNCLIGANFKLGNGTVFTRNILADNVDGVYASPSDSLSVDFNTITRFEKGLVWNGMDSYGAVASHNLIVGSELAGQIGIFDINSIRGNISGNDVRNSDVGILVENSSNTIVGNFIAANQNSGIELRDGSTVHISDNIIQWHNASNGIVSFNYTGLVENNLIRYNTVGMYLDPGSNYSLISKNVFDGNQYGIIVRSWFVQVENNEFINGEEGVRIELVEDVTVNTNDFHNTDIAVSISDSSDIIVEWNDMEEFHWPNSKGILGWDSNFSAKNNTIKRFQYGIFFHGSSVAEIRDNRIEDIIDPRMEWGVIGSTNTATGSINFIGIYGAGSASGVIERNFVSNATGNGIFLNNGGMTTVFDNYVQNTDLWGIGAEGFGLVEICWNTVVNATYGMTAYSPTNGLGAPSGVYHNNTIIDSKRTGLDVIGTMPFFPIDKLVVRDNSIIDTEGLYEPNGSPTWFQSGYGVYLMYYTNVTLINNTVTGSAFAGMYVRVWSWSGQGQPVLITGNTVTGTKLETFGRGIIVLVPGSDPIIEKNHIAQNNGMGVHITQKSRATVRENVIEENSHYGVVVDSQRPDSVISGNTIRSNPVANVYLENTPTINVSENIIENSANGMYAINVTDSEFYANTFQSHTYGLSLEESHRNLILKNTITYSTLEGIGIFNSNDTDILDNILNWNGAKGTGIHLYETSGALVSGNDIRYTYIGVYSRLSDAMIRDNHLEGNYFGIMSWRLYGTFPALDTIYHNTMIHNRVGVWLYFGDVSVSENTIEGVWPSSTDYGIVVWYRFPSLNKNAIFNTQKGIYGISSSPVITESEIHHSDIGVYITSNGDVDATPRIDDCDIHDNTVGASLKGDKGRTVSGDVYGSRIVDNADAGVYMVYSNYTTISNSTITGNYDGITVYKSHFNTLENNTVSYNENMGVELVFSNDNLIQNNAVDWNENIGETGFEAGLYLGSSNGNTIDGNSIANNAKRGVYLVASNDNIIEGNSIDSNTQTGIYLVLSEYNRFKLNTISNNGYGVYSLQFSNSNIIYHNNFIDNTNQAYDDGTNSWDNGNPLTIPNGGGNYWSGWASTSPRAIAGGSNLDNYPFTSQDGWL